MTRRAPHPLRIGEMLGNLQLVRLIGEGGMGSVYEAKHVVLGRRQAVKLLHPEFASDPVMYGRFRREAQIAASVESDHIVPVREFGSANDGTPYLVMDLLEGENLAHLLAREGPLAIPRFVTLMLQACDGLRVAHEHRPAILHRDLKPENLFVRNVGCREVLTILDFGIAKFLGPPKTDSLTRTGVVIGTPHYMSPEQAEGTKSIDQRTDIYALGSIFYELLTGSKAHPGVHYNEIISHILLKGPVPLRVLRSDVPPALEVIVNRALAQDIDERFQSIAQLALELRALGTNASECALVRGELLTARPSQGVDGPTLPSVTITGEPLRRRALAGAPPHSIASANKARSSRHRLVVVGLGCIGLLAFYLRGNRAPSSEYHQGQPPSAVSLSPSPAAEVSAKVSKSGQYPSVDNLEGRRFTEPSRRQTADKPRKPSRPKSAPLTNEDVQLDMELLEPSAPRIDKSISDL